MDGGARFLGRLGILIGCLAVAGFLFASIDWSGKFATDVSVLLPDSEVDDVAASLLAQIREHEERLVFGAVLAPAGGWEHRREAVTRAVLDHLRGTGEFEQVASGTGPSDPDALAAAVYDGRLDLLLPQWAEENGLSLTETDAGLWAEAIVASLDDFLVRPEAAALGQVIPQDPFPLAAYMAEAVPAVVADDETGPILFWAAQKASPFVPAGQEPVLVALEEAGEAGATVLPGVTVRHASVAAIARESETRIRREITLLNVGGVLLVGLVAFGFLRRRAMLVHLLVVAGLSVAGGLAAVVLFFPVVHVLSLVVGGLLVGVAIDYSIHILLHRPERVEGGFVQTLREVRKPLLASGLSTAAGFSALAFAELLLIRQIGVFVAGGLLAALGASWLYFPLWRRTPDAARMASPKARRTLPTALGVGAVVLLVLPLAGWLRLDWRDELRELQPPMPEIWEADAAVRKLFAQGENYAGWISPGRNSREARSLLATFEAEWEAAGGDRADLLSLSPWVATPERRDAVRLAFGRMPDFEETLEEELERAGFAAEEFAPFFEKVDRWLSDDEEVYYEARLAAVAEVLDGPSGMLLREGDPHWWFFVSARADSIPDGWEAPARVVEAAQLETLNELFGEYRRAAWRISGVALLVIAAGLALVYGPGKGVKGLLLPAVAWAWGMGAVAGLFAPLNLFHLLGGFLGFCVALDYGLFFQQARATGRGLPLSIRLSAATTLSAFGVLSLGTIPAVAALGVSVFAVVLGGWFMVELAAVYAQDKDV